MGKVITLRTSIFGLASWFVPFAVSFLFVDQTGTLLVPVPLFKSIMVVVFGGFGTALLVSALANLTPSASVGLSLGLYWMAINLTLDMAVLVPLMRVTLIEYFYDIGIRYLLIPIIALALGIVAQRARSK